MGTYYEIVDKRFVCGSSFEKARVYLLDCWQFFSITFLGKIVWNNWLCEETSTQADIRIHLNVRR